MTRTLFGTDGIRGLANTEPMTASTAQKAAMAAAVHFRATAGRKPKVVIGKDTRLSGYMIENAMASGFLAMGMDVVFLGPLPTPAVSHLTRSLRADMGVMISASHNPYHDNGIKFFSSTGHKLSDAVEKEIEHYMQQVDFEKHFPLPEEIGSAARLDDETGRYIEYLKSTFPENLSLKGLKIVVDCANGAAYKVAPKILWELGADIVPIGVSPNGFNINDKCGATDLSALQEKVVEEKADIGLALDGDADRLIVCDEKGQIVDGDQILALVATDMHKKNKLKNNGVVATVMSNMGLEQYLKDHDIHLIRTPVGDRYVSACMEEGDYSIGGEASGHFIARNFMPTGDGILSALQVLAILCENAEQKSSEILHVFDIWPQVLKNIRYSGSNPLENNAIQEYLSHMEHTLNGKARLLVRKSGTEPLIRVMLEGKDKDMVNEKVEEICSYIENIIAKS